MSEQAQNPSRVVSGIAAMLDTVRGEHEILSENEARIATSTLSEFVHRLHKASHLIEHLEAENRSLQSQNEQLQDKADAYGTLCWLISEGYHDFTWYYDSDTEILTLESSELSVELSLCRLKKDSTAETLRLLKNAAQSEKP